MEKVDLKIINSDWFIQPLSMEKPVLAGSRCRKCGQVFFPKKIICAACFSKGDMEMIPLNRQGELYCYTVAYAAPEGFKPPYAFGRVVLPEGMRIFSILQDCEPFDRILRVGMPVELAVGVIAKDEVGDDLLGYVFRPVKER